MCVCGRGEGHGAGGLVFGAGGRLRVVSALSAWERRSPFLCLPETKVGQRRTERTSPAAPTLCAPAPQTEPSHSEAGKRGFVKGSSQAARSSCAANGDGQQLRRLSPGLPHQRTVD